MDEEWSDDLLDKNSTKYKNISSMLSTQVGKSRQMDDNHEVLFTRSTLTSNIYGMDCVQCSIVLSFFL